MEKHIYLDDILAMEKVPRLTLVNAISGFKSANLIGTQNAEGLTNLAIFSSVVHLGSQPPLMGMINRPVEASPHTLGNIEALGYYTINHVHAAHVAQAHQTSAKYPAEVSEFEACGFTSQYTDIQPAPYVAECKVKMGLKLEEVIPLKINGTYLIIGSVLELIVPEGSISPDGYLDLSAMGTVTLSGLETYYKTEEIARLGYARV